MYRHLRIFWKVQEQQDKQTRSTEARIHTCTSKCKAQSLQLYMQIIIVTIMENLETTYKPYLMGIFKVMPTRNEVEATS